MNKPNILFLFADDQRFDTIGALSNSRIMTPNMDKLVAAGTAFTHAHIPSGTSAAICMPSRAMLHTGRTLFHIQNEGQEIPPEHTTMGEAFGQAGYRTFGIGKWHNGPSAFSRSFSDGKSIFFGGMWDHWNVPLNHYDPTGTYDNEIPFIHNHRQSNHAMNTHCDYFSAGKHSSELFSQCAVDYIQQYDSEDPFFLYVAYLAPHDPRSMPKKFREMYNPEDIKLPVNFMEEHPFLFGVENIRDETLAPYPRPEAEIKQHIAEYYAMITHLDSEIGRVLEALEQSGKADNTIVVLAGDNGLAVGRHGLMGKQNHYEHSIRVPFVMRGPGVPAGQRRSQFVYLLDIFPTLCELTGTSISESVEGRSLVPVLSQPDAPHRDTLFFAYTDSIRSVKNDRYKLIEYADTRMTQLFDLQEDPSELNNLYGNPEAATLASELRQLLARYRDEWNDRDHRFGQSFWSKVDLEQA
ncbi:MAG: sulfatase [Paenibacillaceae bacterium]|nr:sulfatase [Paenibacillaceae bacterium]